jgi:myxalamid-type polyketide synthase MxaC
VNLAERIARLSPAKRALLALELQGSLGQPRREPVAIVGIGCRLPGGGDGPAAFWRLLCAGVDAVGEVPSSRWNADDYYDPDPDAPGKMRTRWGAYLGGIDLFDYGFFGITRREATRMDPQQRLLLEVCWEALEHAGIAPDSLAGTRSGVFVGISTADYAQLQLKRGRPEEVDAYFGTGNAPSVASGRIAYQLGLRGPALSVDTACSSSLVAVHLACQSLRAAECDLALAGGVNAILLPEITVNFSKAGMMAADGRCKTFDAAADGYVRGEGCGVVVLRRLADALAAGDRVHAVLRGSAVNQDGHSGGLTIPNGDAQTDVMRRALADADVAPRSVGYVEAHGTGTALGDPIEMRALQAVFAGPREHPLAVGSVKTNLGHLEAAAGIAGLIKVVMALGHGQIPPHLHLNRLSPHIQLNGDAVVVPTRPTPWPAGDEPRRAGVSSFGFSGTNAHVLLEAPPPPPERPAPARPLHLLTLSARTEPALRALAGRFADQLQGEPVAWQDVCFTSNTGRAHFEHRLALVAPSAEPARERLAAFAAGRPGAAAAGRRNTRPPRVAFLFSGQGAQHAGMAARLFETEPAFRDPLRRCADALAPHLERPLLEVLRGDGGLLDQTVYTQPALFAVEYAIAQLWISWGVEPAAVLGHSVGEYVAACLAGAVDLEAALQLVAARGRLMQALPEPGTMVAALGPEAIVAEAVARDRERVAVAAVNGPENVVVSGAASAVAAVAERLAACAVPTRPLRVSHAFHSPLLDPILDELEQAAARVCFRAPQIRLVSNLTGRPFAGGEVPDAGYWRRHARETVRFADGVRALAAKGCQILLEVGPHPVLAPLAASVLGDEARCLPSLVRGVDDWRALLETAAALYTGGVDLDWRALDRTAAGRPVPLPTYPFQRARCWLEHLAPGPKTTEPPAAAHPLLGRLMGAAEASPGVDWRRDD